MKKLPLDTEQYTDSVTRAIYSQDASIYQITPSAVVVPRNMHEVKAAVLYAAKNKITITPRGAGTNTTGSCLGSGMVLDLSRHLTAIRSFDEKSGRILVEPGLVQDELNRHVARFGLRLGPDTSTGDRATIGGMAACNAAGARSLRFGSMRKAVVGIELMLATGEVFFLKQIPENEYGSHPIFKQLHRIATQYSQEIKNHFPQLERCASGYPLLELINPKGIDFAKLVVGSEGTLGVITAIELQLEKALPPTQLVILSFDSVMKALEYTQTILPHKPISLELIDQTILSTAVAQGYHIPEVIQKNSQALLVAEFVVAPTIPGGIVIKDKQEIAAIWAVRKAGLGLLLSRRSKRRAIGFIEDMAVPTDKLVPFYQELSSLFQKHGVQVGVYGHVGAGCLHIRPFFSLIEDRKQIEEIANFALKLTKKYQGVFSSEHGDGLIRSWATEELFGTPLFEAMKAVKKTFDPANIMNPGKIIPNQTLLENIRQVPMSLPFQPMFHSHQRGGMELTVDLCNGNGACRKMEGTMCPSYQVTKDDRQTTKGRALALKGVMTGDIPKEEMFKESFNDVFDLCISCKGCAHECPSGIDVSKLKSEILHFQNTTKGASWRSKIFGKIGSYLRFGALFPKISNWILHSIFGRIICFLLKIQAPPKLASMRFSTWAAQNNLTQPNTPDVVLFSDTFTEFLEPAIGIAAVKVLKACGLKVQVLPWSCCGRTAISKGFLDVARAQIKKLHSSLSYCKCPVIILEPSCFSVFMDEAPDLGYPFSAPILFEEFLLSHISKLENKLKRAPYPIAIQKHCHLKANTILPQLLRAIPDAQIIPLESGCCGMAGSFGYESEHVEISQKIFDRDVGNKLNKCDKLTITIANGTSCRAQIRRFQPSKVLHVAELFSLVLK